jgi:hypothetical protein
MVVLIQDHSHTFVNGFNCCLPEACLYISFLFEACFLVPCFSCSITADLLYTCVSSAVAVPLKLVPW